MSIDYLDYMDHFGLPRSGIIHVGANNAGEARFYDAYDKVPVAFFEPIPAVYERALKSTDRYPLQRVFHACCSDTDGEHVTFNVSSNRGMSSSMFPLGRHGEIVPGVTYVEKIEMTTSKAETILSQHYRLDDFNLAVIDTQGADLLVLKGLGRYLDYLDAVNIEVSDTPLYEGGATFDQIYRYLNKRGFALAMLHTTNTDWGNAFFKRRQPVHVRETLGAISKGKPSFQSSVLGPWGPEHGNDGDIETRRKFFHTRKERDPWWKVDLKSVVNIKKVYLFDREGQPERVRSAMVEVSTDDLNYSTIYDRGGTLVKKGQNVVAISWRGPARYVRVRLQEEAFLHFRQVAVVEDEFGKPEEPETGKKVKPANRRLPPRPTASATA
jgi:FkbM family methyltransferase